MKTISVKDAAAALGISDRGVLYRREKGKLKGTLQKNERGVDEYRIYPTKEIIEGLRRIGSPLVANENTFVEEDIVDVTAGQIDEADITKYDSTFGPEDRVAEASEAKPDWKPEAKAATAGAADELWNKIISKFMEKIEEKDQLIGELRTEIKDKDRQILLLPDMQSEAKKNQERLEKIAEDERERTIEERRRADAERKVAQEKDFELEAIKKHVDLLTKKIDAAPDLAKEIEQLKAQEDEKARRLNEILALTEQERAAKEAAVSALTKQAIEANEAKSKLEDAQKALDEKRIAEEVKTAEINAAKAALAEISAKLEQAQKPWWQKLLGTGG